MDDRELAKRLDDLDLMQRKILEMLGVSINDNGEFVENKK